MSRIGLLRLVPKANPCTPCFPLLNQRTRMPYRESSIASKARVAPTRRGPFEAEDEEKEGKVEAKAAVAATAVAADAARGRRMCDI